MKKLFLFITLFSLFGFCMFGSPSFNKGNAIKDSKKVTFTDISGNTLLKNMKFGWNLGNTLDATSQSGRNEGLTSETTWGQPKTTQEIIKALAKSGVKTIRIPISWSNHFVDKSYSIDPQWMQRVKTIVDWAIAEDMYVIINSHHDNYVLPSVMPSHRGYYPNSTNYEESKKFLENVWGQITLAFNNGYDEHLIFETMNEPRLRGTKYEWWYDKTAPECKDAALTLNKLNQDVVNTIRASGGNNAKRFIMIPALQASVDSAFSDEFKFPKDSAKNKLILSVHMYSPYNFAMETPGNKEFMQYHKNELALSFKNLDKKFVQNGIPVVIGEYGATNKNNIKARIEWFGFFIKFSRKYNITSCMWDNGDARPDEKNGEKFGYFNRQSKTWYFPEILTAIKENCQ